MTLYSEMCDACGKDGPAFGRLPECEQCGNLICEACTVPESFRPAPDECVRDRVVCRDCYHEQTPIVGAF